MSKMKKLKRRNFLKFLGLAFVVPKVAVSALGNSSMAYPSVLGPKGGEPLKKVSLHIKLDNGGEPMEWALGSYLSDREGNLLPDHEVEKRFDALCFSIRRTLSVSVKDKL